MFFCFFFFFQAEDGIRDVAVTGVQTCALPILPKIVATPIAPLALPEPRIAPRRVAPEVVAAALPGPARDRLAAGQGPGGTAGPAPGVFPGAPHLPPQAPVTPRPAARARPAAAGARA